MKKNKLPKISIVTITRNRSHLFDLAIKNWKNFNYPKELMEWIIVDDGHENLNIPDDKRIKYYKFNENEIQYLIDKCYQKMPNNENVNMWYIYHSKIKCIPIGLKRNLAVQYCKNSYILHMDDDDYYPEDSVKIRVNALYENKCCYCDSIPSFNVNTLKGHIISSKKEKIVSEATLAYKKSFWEDRKFNNFSIEKEGIDFVENREHIKILPYNHIIVSLVHTFNHSRRIALSEKSGNIFNIDLLTYEFIVNMDSKKKYSELGQEHWVLEINNFKKNGTCLEISDVLVNTKLLQEDYNWNLLLLSTLPMSLYYIGDYNKILDALGEKKYPIESDYLSINVKNPYEIVKNIPFQHFKFKSITVKNEPKTVLFLKKWGYVITSKVADELWFLHNSFFTDYKN